ncbi:flagellar brake protein [Sideroxydans lithotrophicus]|uniref:Flagellar brake protein YcgR n=1 Tax=Sideroxydans lithotrophicus (strain ES-1) TaxID=580332 RepID=D5CN17_SIDLE|nr:flagellar brake protein [Sideroxydans lithotrophicus]ADE10853.1 YcgR family protein [Sideroxydans lithotrophicus ES-1]
MRTKEIPLKIEMFSADEENDYLVSNPKEIVSILQTIAQRKSRVALYYNEGNSMVLTMILAVDDHGVWVDAASNPHDNRLIERSKRIIFVTTHNQAKVQFVAGDVVLGTYEDAAAFSLALPRKLLRLQRRDYYRLVTPEHGALKCIIRPVASQAHIQHEVTVMDISIGGVALVCEASGIELQPGMVYEHCQIELPEVGKLEATIEVKNTFEITDRNGKVKRRAGCVFVKPDGKTTMQLQRYVAQMQQRMAAVKSER